MIVIKKVISILLVLVTLLTSIPYTALALSWDGDSAGGSTNAVNGSSTGYVIRSTSDSACVVGYRFSAVDSDGDMKVTKVIDVYRKTSNGNNAYSTSAKFSKKYNKLGIIANKNANLTTTENTTNCYKESNMGFVTELPNPSGVETWQSYETNINKVLSKLGVGSVSNMAYGDKVIIEPLFDVCLAGEYQALTVSEMAYCGRSVLGGSSKGGTSNGTSSTWGFIASYTNRIWPNKLYTPNGQGLWTGVSAIGSSSKETFNNIMTKGYGVGIAYTEETNNTYTIKFNGNGHTSGSTASMSMTYGVAKNLTANGFSKTGHYFNGWNTKSNGSGTSYSNKQSVKNLTSTNGATVTLYAQWVPYTLKISYHANGGSENSSSYYLSSSLVYKNSDSSKLIDTWTYNQTKTNGLWNAASFGLYKTGYRFVDWGTSSSGGTHFGQDDTSLKPTDLKSTVATGNRTMTLYAQWTPNTYTIKFNGNGATSGSTAQMSMTYDVAKNLTANGFTKSGYHFSGWNTKADGTGTSYYNKQSVRNLTSTHGATITLYAQWDTNSYTIAFDGNGNTGGNTSSMTMKFDVAKNLNKNGYTITGYTFSKWNTKANGSGTNYTNQQSVKNLTTVNGGTFYLYAQWTPNTYTIKFNGNGATSGSTAQMSMTYDVAKNLTANGFKKTGYVFDGWNTNSSGTGTNYTDKQSVKNLTSTNGGTVTLYAKWKPITYTIKFNGNGATSGSTAQMSMTYDVAKNLTANGFTRTSYKFLGWNTKADGSGTNYTDKQSVKNLTTTNGATITLYAKWQYDPVLAVKECDVYSGNKSNKTTLFGITTGNVFDDYVYKTDYPTIGDTVWYNIYFPAETENFKARQYVKYKGGSWQTRDVTLSSSNSSSQWFPVQFTGNYKTIAASQQYFEIQAKTDWIDSNGNVLKSGATKTFYIPIKPVVHRTQVSATGYEGNVVAYSGSAGSSGKLYSGQRVNIAYKYTADNTWSAVEYLRGSAYTYKNSKWTNIYGSNDGYDAAKNKIGISKSSAISLNSSLNTYTVPITSQNKLRFNLETWWASDKTHTVEETWYELPVVKSDVALTKITLVNSSTKATLDPNNLEAGQSVLVRYTYKNNTDVKVYVEGFKNDKSKIIGVYAIPAKSSITVDGYTFSVPNKREISIWGGVYLEGMGIYNTDYESDGSNNALTLKCKVKHPLTLQPIPQNADYREGTEVITSFWLKNRYTDDYAPSANISVKFNVYKGSSLIKTYTKTQAIVPGTDNNLLYFKWTVPTGLNSADVKITGEIIEAGVSYNKVSANYSTTPKVTSVTPDTQFEKKAPSGFTISTLGSRYGTGVEWWEWSYSGGSFVKKQYKVTHENYTGTITPANTATATKQGSIWNMNSGYGFTLSLNNGVKAAFSGFTTAPASSYTLPQTGVAYFPEYKYATDYGKYTSLVLTSGKWTFPANGSYGKVHFTPLWYPDGDYKVRVKLSDLWTPAGMIYMEFNTNYIKIKDSAYDDWYVGR
ncbi:MAG: InlB B-repeat-containing protein [Acutalibacteraceae bacterium]|nr:InlB B-repeat-containing protein [Acutalibacteraceae bacterium]